MSDPRSLLSSLANDVSNAVNRRNHDDREFELVVFGASGFVGKLICEYLARHAPNGLKWALAGRDSNKLVKVRSVIANIAPQFKEMAILIVDSRNYTSLEMMASSTRVVISAAGPYIDLGIDLIKACVNQKTDYLDLSNEPAHLRRIIEAFDTKAEEQSTIIVPACGFYSVPADIGAYMLTKHIRHEYHRETKRIKGTLSTYKEVRSRGTVLSLLSTAKLSFSTLRQMMDPYYLVVGKGPRPTNVRDFFLPVYYDSDFHGAQGYFAPSTINEQLVRRTNQVKEYKYGDKFTYTESRTYSSLFSAIFHTGVEVGFSIALMFPPFRWFLRAVWPRWTGEPAKKKISGGNYTMKFVARARREKSEDKTKIPEIKALITDNVDPNFEGSAKIISEAALGLVKDRHGMPGHEGGVLTPMSAFGMPLVERLRQAGMHIEIGQDAW